MIGIAKLFISPSGSNHWCISRLAWILLGLSSGNCWATTSLSLGELLKQASAYYPALQAARLERAASTEDLEAARRLYWPSVSAVTESSTAKTYSAAAVPSRYVQIEQTLWDAGLTKAKIHESSQLVEIQDFRVALLLEEVSFQLANAWQNLQACRERMAVASQTIERLRLFQQQMQRRVNVEASPRIDLELAHSRILQTQVEHMAAQNSQKQAIARIEQYTGRTDLQFVIADKETQLLFNTPSFAEATVNSINWQKVVDQHPSVAKATAEAKQSQSRLDQKKAEAKPQIYARISQPLSNLIPGYTSGPTAFIGLRYTTSPGFTNELQAQALTIRVAGAEELVKSVSVDLTQAIKADQDEYQNAKLRLDSLEKAAQGADLVLSSYQRQFHAGKKTWQDLLNAVRELAQNQYALADARASMNGAMIRLQIRAGLEIQ